jgi:hypothetical protein
MTTTPEATYCQNDGTFMSVSPFCKPPSVNAPMSEQCGFPTPPNKLAPPITATPIAVMLGGGGTLALDQLWRPCLSSAKRLGKSR